MVEPLRLPVVHKLRVAQSLVGGPTAAGLAGLSPVSPVTFPVLSRLLGHEGGVSLELGAAQHARRVVLSQGLFYLQIQVERAGGRGTPRQCRGNDAGAGRGGGV